MSKHSVAFKISFIVLALAIAATSLARADAKKGRAAENREIHIASDPAP